MTAQHNHAQMVAYVETELMNLRVNVYMNCQLFYTEEEL